ncbi:hypothetical protein [Chitinophaga nivalis]|uniref:Uncharacterized protein n=1 Tax=Chitinophaga nivalis TaxID=2991709 RepID=A0ABT3IQF9_9BACT|nr:hypothetical protein [Chitinophaga nivalis]MCW3464112.1 hypothetical protein [Chitinophaga nivalis]MCW3486198.1 hypothetical protein [Chitinophaga nivalis]
MKQVKFAIAAIAAVIGFASLTQAAGSRFSNLTFRTVKGALIATLGVNPTTAQIAQYKLDNCTNAPTQVCAYAFKDGSLSAVDHIKGQRIQR